MMPLFALPPEPPAIVGRATVIDGDTLEIHGQRIRLWGVDAPESRQTCERAGSAYRCGQEASNALSGWIGQRTVTCTPRGRPDRYRRIIAQCRVQGADMAIFLVGRGYALDYRRYSGGHYAQAESLARDERRGVWAGEFDRPWDWRQLRGTQ